MKKLIEMALPLKKLSSSSMGEKAHKGHPGNMHLWWHRSPVDASTALLKAVIENASSYEQQTMDFNLAIQAEQDAIAKTDTEATPRIGTDKYPIICDPFSGFGGLAIAAQKAGLNVQAGDLNAVATLLTKAATEIPSRFADARAVNPASERKMYFGAEGLATDVEYYGGVLKKHAEKALSNNYPEMDISGKKLQVYSWIWVRTMECPNPACRCQMPMATSYVLSKLKGKEYWAEPVVEENDLRFVIHQGICPEGKETNKHGSNGSKFQCPVCGTITKDEEVKAAGKNGRLNIQLMAVSVLTQDGRIFVEPDDDQRKAAMVAIPEDTPIGAIPINSRWFSPPGFGLTEYADIYTPRQLLLLTTFCNLIPKIIEQATADALAMGMAPEEEGLNNGGNGALAYGQAIGVYLALAIGKMVNFQSTICTWDNRNGNVRAAFTRQAMPMTWVFAEGNPFSSATGNFDSMLKSVYESVARLYTGGSAVVQQDNATTMQFPPDSILFTELPYYDNVGYSDLSDYFYIWLRKCLRDVYPELFKKVVTSKEELASIPEHYHGDAVAAVKAYRTGIEQLCCHFYAAASEEYPSVIFYEYSDQDEKSIEAIERVNDLSPLEYLLHSLMKEGFMISGIWPIRTEKPNPCFKSFRIAVIFRKKSAESHNITRRVAINTLKRELPGMLDIAFREDIDELDKPVSALGLGLSVLTRYRKVLNADGSEMDIHDALQLIWHEAKGYLDACSINTQTEEG